MGEQASLFDLEPAVDSSPPNSRARALQPKVRGASGKAHVQLGIVGVDEDAEATRWIAEAYTVVEAGGCPFEGQPRPRRCPLTRCSNHLLERRNGDKDKTPEEIGEDLVEMTYWCVEDFVADFPDGASDEQVGAALRISRQSAQEEAQRALDNPAWDWETRLQQLADDHDMFRELGRADFSDPEVKRECIRLWFAAVRAEREAGCERPSSQR